MPVDPKDKSSQDERRPKSLIVNSPFAVPALHWERAEGSEERMRSLPSVGRRAAGYEIFDPKVKEGGRRFVELGLVNKIRKRVDRWRAAEYPGVTAITRQLLDHWHAAEVRESRFYFCQLEAIETLIWWVEATDRYRQGIAVPGDGGAWERLCSKMATGTGKTAVMAMIIAWQALNALTYPRQRRDFSSSILVVTPGLTVRERLAGLCIGHHDDRESEYDRFAICPEGLREKLNRARVQVINWHVMLPPKDSPRGVVKLGAMSDKVFARSVLQDLGDARRLVVINDEAHHAYRKREDVKVKRQESMEDTTRWVEGLDRIHKARGIVRCFDLSATPLKSSGHETREDDVFGWIVSDFGLNDAIESGLVKIPRVVVRDDGLPSTKDYQPRLRHIYREVKDELGSKAPVERDLPGLVTNAYRLLANDWEETRKNWESEGHTTPPVMLTVCDSTRTAERVENYFKQEEFELPKALRNVARILRVDSKVLDGAEREEKSGKSNQTYKNLLKKIVKDSNVTENLRHKLLSLPNENLLRHLVDTVGKPGKAGGHLHNVISVSMLSEGWDAKNVTHIMGIRAFTSQLLCEQVIGRGLRRISHDLDEHDLFQPEYVNIFGVPLSIFESFDGRKNVPSPPKPTHLVQIIPERAMLEISWPNVLQVERNIRPELRLNWSKIKPFQIAPSNLTQEAEIAPALSSLVHRDQSKTLNLSRPEEDEHLQSVIFQCIRKAIKNTKNKYSASHQYSALQLVGFVNIYIEKFSTFSKNESPDSISCKIEEAAKNLLTFIEEANTEYLRLVYDNICPIGTTKNMRPWYTIRSGIETAKSHINRVVADSAWEQDAANSFEKNDQVLSYFKNDRHTGFQIHYLYQGIQQRYIPDFLLRLACLDGREKHLILEIRGHERDVPQSQAKKKALDTWIEAVNLTRDHGSWCSDIAYNPNQIEDVIVRHSS